MALPQIHAQEKSVNIRGGDQATISLQGAQMSGTGLQIEANPEMPGARLQSVILNAVPLKSQQVQQTDHVVWGGTKIIKDETQIVPTAFTQRPGLLHEKSSVQ